MNTHMNWPDADSFESIVCPDHLTPAQRRAEQVQVNNVRIASLRQDVRIGNIAIAFASAVGAIAGIYECFGRNNAPLGVVLFGASLFFGGVYWSFMGHSRRLLRSLREENAALDTPTGPTVWN